MFYYEDLGDAVIRTRKNDVHHRIKFAKQTTQVQIPE